jgi:hypothetical protein
VWNVKLDVVSSKISRIYRGSGLRVLSTQTFTYLNRCRNACFFFLVLYFKWRLSIHRLEFKFSSKIFCTTFCWLQEEGIYLWYKLSVINRDTDYRTTLWGFYYEIKLNWDSAKLKGIMERNLTVGSKTPWSESASELYRRSDRRLLAK